MKKGFTLIELLIVIAVLGILAAGILATIDPFEQFKKARDSNVRNTLVEAYNAFIRYNANHGNWPWDADPADTCTTPSGTKFTSMTSCIGHLVDDGELKAGFSSALSGANAITSAYITYVTSPSENVRICFKPDSKSLRKDSATKYDSTGQELGTCGTSSSNCYWCAM